MGPQLLFTLFAFAGGIGIGLSACRLGDRLVTNRSPYRSALLAGALAGLATVPVQQRQYERRARQWGGGGLAWVAAVPLPAGRPVPAGDEVRAEPLPRDLSDWIVPLPLVQGHALAAPLQPGDVLTPGSLSTPAPEACQEAPTKAITPVRRAP